MKVFWNYLFFVTWKTLCSISIHYIEKPIDYIFNLIPYFRNSKRKSNTNNYSRSILHNKKIGFNISLSFYLLLITTFFFIFMSIFWIFSFYLNWIDFKNELLFKLDFIISFIISCYINYHYTSWNNSGYLDYFNSFEKERNKNNEIVIFILFYFINIIYFALSVYFLISYEQVPYEYFSYRHSCSSRFKQ